ncbi:hypothetical protein [Psychrobacillus sp. FSL K6-2843]|uniref:hypothetical protein n=1 Tax=Psychrobacillus sp. FSL K6-2843 TaxID=2921549 RepID=UPI0012B09348|nr:hypothetical protein GI482_03465 [Bacillus sp. N3536]
MIETKQEEQQKRDDGLLLSDKAFYLFVQLLTSSAQHFKRFVQGFAPSLQCSTSSVQGYYSSPQGSRKSSKFHVHHNTFIH